MGKAKRLARPLCRFLAIAGIGFYCFAAYCLVSNAAFQLLRVDPETGLTSAAASERS